jgi:hypothetical protein
MRESSVIVGIVASSIKSVGGLKSAHIIFLEVKMAKDLFGKLPIQAEFSIRENGEVKIFVKVSNNFASKDGQDKIVRQFSAHTEVCCMHRATRGSRVLDCSDCFRDFS